MASSNGQDDTNQESSEDEKMVFSLTPDQAEIVHQVISECIKDLSEPAFY